MTEKKGEKPEKKEMTPIERTLVATSLMLGSVGTSCAVTDRCKNVRTVQVSCCCDLPHYAANSCEQHIATAVRRIVGGGCEVHLARVYTNGKDQKLFENRRAASWKLGRYEEFVNGKLKELDGMVSPSPYGMSDQAFGEELGAYMAKKEFYNELTQLRNSVDPS